MNKILDKLNDRQREAVLQAEGPVLILAGAGSGKTTVIVSRIAYMIREVGISPRSILAITFTNKAANEMKQRVVSLLGDVGERMQISTFHSVCVRILRETIAALGYGSDFVIYDSDDSKTLMKQCLKELNLDEKLFPVRSVLSVISKAKDNMLFPKEFAAANLADRRLSVIARIYELYEKKLKDNNALDFDNIVLFTVKIFTERPQVLEVYREKFRYIMVDEYQDTSTVQYKLVSLLASGSRNLCVVGDDDQSIYKFRGANINNILNFEKEFPDARVIKLEQNYRSTQKILSAANSIIKNNSKRKSKELWTDNADGESVKLFTADNEHKEAQFVAEEIERLVKEGVKYSDIAILYRTNAQSRVMEEACLKNVIPYRVLSGLRFYDRREIKDIIAYMRLILNPNDNISLERIINSPKRGIGAVTLERAARLAEKNDVSEYEIFKNISEYPELSKAASKCRDFVTMIENLQKLRDTLPLKELVSRIMIDSGYNAALTAENTVDAETRLQNLNEFLSVVQEYEQEEGADFEGLLENISLVSNIDFYDEDEDYVVMMTVHSAKGLEFPNVFIIGMDDGLFPSIKYENLLNPPNEDMEEERRLCYVAVTRAKERLYMTNTVSRTIFGHTSWQKPSRFLRELAASENITPISKRASRAAADGAKRAYDFLSDKEKNETPVSDYADFKPGDYVMHRKFGMGMVVAAKQYGRDMLLDIAFDTAGRKQLMAAFAKLEKIDR